MKRKMVIISLVFLIMFVLPINSEFMSLTHEVINEHSVLKISEYTPHDPIVIGSDEDFEIQGWPGNGTEENPYRIEGLFINEVIYPEYPISISNTRADFIIQNCFLNNFTDTPYAGIGLSNTSNGIIKDNYIDRVSRSIYIHDVSSNVSILNNKLGDVHQSSVRISDSFNIIITENEISGGILLEITYDIYVFNNNIYGCNSYSGRNACINGLRCNSTQIVNNNITAKFDYCMVFETTSQILIINNTCISGGHGIFAHWTSDVLVESNYIEFYGEGIETEYCENWIYNNNTLIRMDDEPPIITPVEDINYEMGDFGYSIDWSIVELNPLNYSIIRDDIIVISGKYGRIISISIDGLDIGIYEYVLIVFENHRIL